jgi:hypothetical protein
MGTKLNSKTRLEDMCRKRITLLGAGPMSKVSIDAIIELSQTYDFPISMIPSRRQIECAELGGGYVENWSTEVFSSYVRKYDKKGTILLSRDHCGPWQLERINPDGSFKSLDEEMQYVKISLKADIESDFDIIHIDPSLGLRHGLDSASIRKIAIEMIKFCETIKRKELIYEIGTEEQHFAAAEAFDSEIELLKILEELSNESLPAPTFYVQQTGTKVMETKNVGSFDTEIESKGLLPTSFQINKTLEICERNGVWLKEHNADYLSDEALKWHKRFGIHGSNVAPEFGVVETKTLVNLAIEINALDLLNELEREVVKLGKWKKWMLDNSQATNFEKMLIAGHYHFSEKWFIEWREQLQVRLAKKTIDLNTVVYTEVRKSIKRYLDFFGYKNEN